MKKICLLLMLAYIGVAGAQAWAEETRIMIRARSLDAKFIGSSVGGVRVIIEDSESGRVLDEGFISGGTGDTGLLMETPHQRGSRQTDDSTAGYLATLDIDHPVHARIRLLAPYGSRQALHEAQITAWLLPGRHIQGDGLIVRMPGLIVDGWTQFMTGNILHITADVSMLCGCPITDGGLWDASGFQVQANVIHNDELMTTVPLKFVSENGFFMGQTPVTDSGVYQIVIQAFQPATGNTGVVRTQRKISL